MIKIALLTAALMAVAAVPAMQSAHAQSMDDAPLIPEWIKILAESWVDGSTSDAEFSAAIGHLVSSGVIKIGMTGLDDNTLNIGFTPVKPLSADAIEFKSAANDFTAFLESELGISVESTTPSSYEPIIEGLRFGHIDAAIMDTGPACLAHTQSGAEVLMAEVDSGRIYYQATVWVSADNDDITELGDVLGKKVSFTSQTGSSGFVRPFGSLVTAGLVTINGDDVIALEQAIDDAFASHAFPGSYGGAAQLLAAGQVDVAFGNDRLPNYLPEADRGLIKAAFTLGPVPSHVLMVSSTMSESDKKTLTDAMLQLNGGPHNDVLVSLYEAGAMLPTTTDHHMAGFCDNINDLAGFEDRLLDKYDN